MKLTKAINFSQTDMKIYGFTNLGEYTPEKRKRELGDHALVFMIQPFKGKWVQSLSCFLSKGVAFGSSSPSNYRMHHSYGKIKFFIDVC